MNLDPNTLDWSSRSEIMAYQKGLEDYLEEFLVRLLEPFYRGVLEDAMGALDSPALVASARKVPDPFAFTNVLARWYSAIRELTNMRDTTLDTLGVDQSAIERVLENSNLPLRAYEDVAVILHESREQGWTAYRTKRALSKLLIPKETSGKWETRSEYRVAISNMARTVATETLGVQSQRGIERKGYLYKTWLSHKDTRVRHTHLAANGQTVPVRQAFTVGLSKLKFPGDPTAPVGEVINCRCVMKGTNTMDKAPKDHLLASGATAEDVTETHPDLGLWQGTIVIEGQMTGDGRLIDKEALSWDSLPIPLRYVESDNGGHDGAVVVGTIQTLARVEREEEPGVFDIEATGTFDLDSEVGREAYRKVSEGLLPGVSADLDNMDFEIRLRREVLDSRNSAVEETHELDGEELVTVSKRVASDEVHFITSARLRAATLVSIPAFEQARIEIMEAELDDEELDSELIEELTSELTENSTDIEEFNWVDNVGGLPRYIKRIAKHLQAKGMSESHAIASAVNTVKRWARGGKNVTPKTRAKAIKALAEWEAKKARAKAQHSLVASGAMAPTAPPNSWFLDPGLTEPTPITITSEGRVYGHLATWDTCHVGQADYCVTPPTSKTGYAYFHTGAVITAENHEVAVGHIVLGTTHASGEKGVTSTMAHYEHTGLAVADVRAGEDAYGIWVSGALRPGISEADIRTLRSSPLSGDWRRVQGNLELVTALAVNMPGFPIPRPKGSTRDGDMFSLVASGMIAPRKVPAPSSPNALSSEDVAYLKNLLRKERLANVQRMARQVASEKRAKIEALANKLKNGEL